jgi:hypothetical protein
MLAESEIAADATGRLDHRLVDEYQDTNRLQAEGGAPEGLKNASSPRRRRRRWH